MGEVWAGIHREQQVPVAVKVLLTASARNPSVQQAFRNEVRAVAGLDHPGIVVVYDHGLIPPEAEAATAGRLPAGSPYLAMERATGGTLHASCGSLDWPSLRLTLLALLDALAHAHARGVIHRDLKPGNVLLGGIRPGPRISDFGVAHAIGREAGRGGGGAGTPAYMAPEQFDSSSAGHGPWTDLYALGCLAWTLATGTPPFGRLPLPRMRAAHRSQPVPALVAAMALPDGFEDWTRTLLEKDPARRFQRAADAAHALLGLSPNRGEGGADVGELMPPGLVETTLEPIEQEPTWTWSAGEVAGDGEDGLTTPPASSGYVILPSPPPQPADWRRPGPVASLQLLGAGLHLYGMRSIPLVAREAERDALWAALGRVREGRPEAVVLSGPAGVGKSRLARWLCERAHESGAADKLVATHAPGGGPDEGLGPLLYRHFGLAGLRPAAARTRIEARLRRLGLEDPDDVAAVHLLAVPGAMSTAPRARVRLVGPAEPHALVRRVLERTCVDRPLVLVLEDVQWGADALSFTRSLLESDSEARMLVVLTASAEHLAERPVEQAQVAELLALPRVRELPVGPLDEDGRAELVHQLLGLEGVLAAQLEERSGGNPLFLVQLVGDWVERGLLVPGERGFRLVPGAEVHLPDDVHEVWAERIRRALGDRPVAETQAVELAAALGLKVSTAEWRAVCAEAGLPAPLPLVDQLVEWRLLTPEPGGVEEGWGFVHNMLRESLERLAREGGRADAHHRACAAVLERGPREPGVAERLARHLAAAGDPGAALEPLLAGARERLEIGEHGAAEDLLAMRERLLDAAAVPPADPRRAEGWMLRCVAAMLRGDLATAEPLGRRALESASEPAARARALLTLSRVQRRRGSVDGAGAAAREAAELAERSVQDLRGPCFKELGAVELAQGHLDEAAAWLDRVLGLEDADDLLLARTHANLAAVAAARGRYAEALPHLDRARTLFARMSSRDGVAECCNARAEIHRHCGQLAEAESGYREAAARFRALGSGSAVIPQLNLGLALLARGAWDEADEELGAAEPVLERQGRWPLLAKLLAGRMTTLARQGRWDGFDTSLDRVAHLLSGLRSPGPEVPDYLRVAAELAAEAGHPERARRARELCVEAG